MRKKKLETWLEIYFKSVYRDAFMDGVESTVTTIQSNLRENVTFEEVKAKATKYYEEQQKPLLKLNKIIKPSSTDD